MKDLETLRQELDRIDKDLLDLVAKRFTVTQQVGEYKKAHNLPVRDLAREQSMFERIRSEAKQHQLDPDFCESLYTLIINEVVKNHEAIKRS